MRFIPWGSAGGGGGGGASTLLNGLKVYYALSDTTDSSGNGLTLTNHGVVTFTAGKVGNAANFASASTQWLSHADAAPYQMGTGDFSYAFWVKFTITVSAKSILDYGQSGTSNGWAVDTVNLGGSTVGLQVSLSDNSTPPNYPFLNSSHTWNNGAWHLVVVTNSRAGNIVLYVDNAQDGSTSATSNPGSVNSTNGFALAANYAGGNLFDGSVDEFGLWNRVLTTTEITNLWNGGAGTTYPFTGL